MNILEQMFAILMAAATGEAIIEFVFSPPITLALRRLCRYMSEEDEKLTRDTAFHWLSAALGIGIAMNFSLGFFGAFGFTGHIMHVDMILTGALIGRGSNWVHEYIKKMLDEKTGSQIEIRAYQV